MKRIEDGPATVEGSWAVPSNTKPTPPVQSGSCAPNVPKDADHVRLHKNLHVGV